MVHDLPFFPKRENLRGVEWCRFDALHFSGSGMVQVYVKKTQKGSGMVQVPFFFGEWNGAIITYLGEWNGAGDLRKS